MLNWISSACIVQAGQAGPLPKALHILTRDGHGRQVADGQREADGQGAQRSVAVQVGRDRLLLLDEAEVDGHQDRDEKRDAEDDVVDHRDLLRVVHFGFLLKFQLEFVRSRFEKSHLPTVDGLTMAEGPSVARCSITRLIESRVSRMFLKIFMAWAHNV